MRLETNIVPTTGAYAIIYEFPKLCRAAALTTITDGMGTIGPLPLFA